MKVHSRLFFLLFGFVLMTPFAGKGQDSAEPGEEKDWLEFYYENPTPDRFVAQMKDWATDGTLDNDHAKPALIAFISQIIRQNRDKLADWYSGLAGLEPSQMQVMLTAMLFSRTTEADEILKEQFGKAYEEQKQETQKILEMPLDKRDTVDMLWGFYYATGSPEAIRRLIYCFRFRDAPDKPDGVDVPDGYVPLYKELPAFAHNSLVANGERHQRVIDILKVLLEKDESLLDMEKAGVRGVLEELGQLAPGKEA